MDSLAIHTFGPQFLLDDIDELELLTDLLFIKEDHLNILFAVASYLERVPNGFTEFHPRLRKRLQHSSASLRFS